MKASLVVLVCVLAMMTATSLVPADQPERRHIKRMDGPVRAELPYSDGVLVGDTLYLAGKTGLDPETGRPPDDLEAEIRRALDDFEWTLEQADMTMDDLVYVQVFCADVTLYEDFNRVYRTYFTEKFPARAFIGSGPLLRGARFEVQGIAVKR